MADEKTWEQKLSEIRAMDVASLTEADKQFLIARRSHLNADELARFADVLPEDDIDADAGKPLEEHSDKELAKVAKSLGLKAKDFEDRDQLIAAIKQQQEVQQSQQ